MSKYISNMSTVNQGCMPQSAYQLEFGRHVAQCYGCRWAHMPTIYTASHVDCEKRVAWFSISMHAFISVAIVMGLRLAALRTAGAPLTSLYLSLCGFSCFQHIILKAFRIKNV